MHAIVTRQLRKSYGSHEVLHGIDLCVPAGTLFGFLGPNGAGKTTTIRILMGLLRPSGGTAQILNRDTWRCGPAVRAGVGYQPSEGRFYDNLSGRRMLAFLDAARGGGSAGHIKRLAGAFGLDLGRRVRDYSHGMRQKLGLIQAMMHRPDLLILDEPSAGLDPLVRETLYAELRSTAAEGRTVLFSSHTLSEVEALCDRVAILRDGRLVEQERIEVLRSRALRKVEIRFDGDAEAIVQSAPEAFALARRDGAFVSGAWRGPVQPLLDWLGGAAVKDVTITPPDLEDLFLTYYADPPAEAPA